jgi:hypothetical protein
MQTLELRLIGAHAASLIGGGSGVVDTMFAR